MRTKHATIVEVSVARLWTPDGERVVKKGPSRGVRRRVGRAREADRRRAVRRVDALGGIWTPSRERRLRVLGVPALAGARVQVNYTAQFGTVSPTSGPSGTPVTYTAPGTVPPRGIDTVTATNAVDPTKFATAQYTIGVPGQGRDPAFWPFNALSPWNYPIGSNANYVALTTALGPLSSSYINGSRWATWIHVAQQGDPVNDIYWFHGTGVWNTNHFQRRVTSNWRAGTGEGWISIIQPDHLTCHEGNSAVNPNTNGQQGPGPINLYDASNNWDLKGPGYVSDGGSAGGNNTNAYIWYNGGDATVPQPTGAAGWPFPSGTTFHDNLGGLKTIGIPLIAGAIRAGELANGIPHALSFAAEPTAWAQSFGSRSFVWPGNNGDGQGGGGGNMQQAGLVALLPSFNVGGLSTLQGQNMARALINYGAYGCGSGGTGIGVIAWYMDGYAIDAETLPSAGDLNLIASGLYVVLNGYAPGGGKPSGVKLHGGDGTLLAPLAPPFAF